MTAWATAAQAETEGAAKAHLSYLSVSRMQGYADVKSTNRPGASHTATNVPIAWAYHCLIGGVRSRKPVRKSPVRLVATSAAPDAMPPAIKLSFWACAMVYPCPDVAAPKTS